MAYVEPSSPPLHLEGALTLRTVESWRPRLLEHAIAHGSLILDLAAVSAADTNGVQLLLSARRTALTRGLPFALRSASAPVRKACTDIAVSLETHLALLS